MNPERLLAHYEQIADAPDAAGRLRRFILDLAVRGKLVPQDPKDEPASELLKRIAAEKARLVESGELRKPRDLDNGDELVKPFAIPSTWRWARLDAVGAVVGGGTPSATDEDNFAEPGEGTPWITPADLGGYSELYISRGSRDLSKNGLRTSSATVMPRGTVLFTSRAPIGYVAIAANPISTNQGFKSIVPYIADCSRFIATAMKAFAPEIDANAPGTTFREVSGRIVSAIPFPLPPLAEQHRIVAKVDELIGLCDQLEAARAEREATRDRLTASSLSRLSSPDSGTFQDDVSFVLNTLPALTTRPDQIKQLRQTILNLAVRGKLAPQDPNDEPALELLKRIAKEKAPLLKAGDVPRDDPHVEINQNEFPFALPNGWSLTRLAAISRRIHYGYTASSDSALREIRMLRITDIQENAVDWEAVPGCTIDPQSVDKYRLAKGDILIARTGGTIGKTFLVGEVPVTAVFASYLIRVQGTSHIFDQFLKLFLESPLYWTQLYEGARGTGQPNVNGQTLGRLILPLPPLAEQHRIVAKVDELIGLCDQLEASLTDTAVTRSRLLDSLLAETLEPA
jgi:type I restriction enzyme S subunit